MQIRTQHSMKENIATVKATHKEGFRVATIESFHSQTDVGNPASHFTDKVRMETPYKTKDGARLIGYCNVKHAGIDKPLQVDTVELWTLKSDGYTPDRNYEDVFLSQNPSAKKIDIFDSEGNLVTFDDVENKIADCAASTVQFPHVMHYDEWKDFQSRNFARLQLDAPTGDGYNHYLDSCKSMIKSGNMPYVGEVTDADFVDTFRSEAPQADETGLSAESEVDESFPFD